MRRLMATLPPAKNAMPMLCSVTTVGNAHIRSESQIHSLSALCSIQAKTGSTTSDLVFGYEPF